MAGTEIREVRVPSEVEQALATRCAGLVAEQGVAGALELDGYDQAARHLPACRKGEPVATQAFYARLGCRVWGPELGPA